MAPRSASSPRRDGVRHRRRHGHGQDARHPPDRRGDPPRRPCASASSTASARRRRRRRPGTSSSSPPGLRAGGSRMATSWRPTRWSSTRSTRPPPSWNSVSRSASARAAGSSGCRRQSIRGSTRAISRPPRCIESRAFDPAKAAACTVVRKEPSEFLDDRFLRDVVRDSAVASACFSRRGPRWSRRRQRRRAISPDHGGVLSRRRADPRHPPVPRRRRAQAVRARDDGGGPERAQRARARHGRDRRHALHQRDRARPQRADPAAPRRQRDPADGGARARPRRRAGACSSCPIATSTSRTLRPASRSFSWPATPSASRSPAPRSACARDDLDLPVPARSRRIPACGRAAGARAASSIRRLGG